MRILHLDIDTLRPELLGCYVCERDTSPNIHRISSEGVRFGLQDTDGVRQCLRRMSASRVDYGREDR